MLYSVYKLRPNLSASSQIHSLRNLRRSLCNWFTFSLFLIWFILWSSLLELRVSQRCDLLCSSGQYLTVQWSNFYWILVGKMLHRKKIKWCQSNKATPVVETYAAQLTCELCSRWEIYMHDTATCWAVTVFYSSSKIDQLMCMNLLLFILIPFLLKNGTDQRTVTLQQKVRGLKISKISFSSAFLLSQGICLVYYFSIFSDPAISRKVPPHMHSPVHIFFPVKLVFFPHQSWLFRGQALSFNSAR